MIARGAIKNTKVFNIGIFFQGTYSIRITLRRPRAQDEQIAKMMYTVENHLN